MNGMEKMQDMNRISLDCAEINKLQLDHIGTTLFTDICMS